MRQEEKLLRAIGGVDDELIADAMEPRKNKRPALIRWAAVAACVCLVLTASVGAEKWGVEWWNGQKEAYGMFGDEEMGYTLETRQITTVEWKYPFEPVTIRQEALDELTGQLNQQWDYRWMVDEGFNEDMADYHFLTGMPQTIEERITTISELEAYLGVDLVTSPKIDAAAFNCMHTNDIGIWLEVGLLGDIYRDAAQEHEQNGAISLQGIHITVRMGFSKTNCKSWMEIYIPITQKFADTYPAEVLYDAWNLDPLTVETHKFSSREVLVVCDPLEPLEDNPEACGIYGADGIGYNVHCLVEDWDGAEDHPAVYQHGSERLMELLENLE